MLILGCGNHLYALDRRTGQGRKRRLAVASRGGGETLEPRVLGLSTIHGSSRHRVFLVATDVGLLSSHDGGSQFERWQTAHADDTVLAVATSPAVGADRRIFVATAGGALLASGAGAVDLLLVDEADRLKMPELEEIRDRYDCANFADGAGVVLIGLPGIEKRLARYPQLYSRVGFVHHFRPLSEDELRFILAHKWHEIGLTVSPDDYTDAEALAAIARITGGNFRLVQRLFSQIARILRINHLQTITQEVVEAAREQLVIGHLP
ncbi:MAG: AAA family ATPase [Thermomicrobiales bacterium]